MSWECCDRKIKTPYCPRCGKAKDDGPMMELLRYVRGMERRAKSWLETARKHKHKHSDYHIERSDRNYKRWARMSKALAEVVGKE